MRPALLAALLALAPAQDAPKTLRLFREEFVPITPGKGAFPASFRMGGKAEGPVRDVRFGYSFHVARYEVPQNLWEEVMGGNPSRWKGPRNSVELLSFDEAVEFCRKATERLRAAKLIEADEAVRLPSDKQRGV